MYALGITQNSNKLRWVLAHRGKTIEILRREESLTIPDEILSMKGLKIVVGLAGPCVMRRDLKLPCVKSSTLRKALPFQLEPLLPFPLNACIVFLQLYTYEKESLIITWTTLKSFVKDLIEKWNKLGIDPDIISSETLALARWTEYAYPQEAQLVMIHGNIGIALEPYPNNCRIITCATESPDPARLQLFFKNKHPLFSWKEEESPFTLATGLALEAFKENHCQFRPRETPCARQLKREKALLKALVSVGTALLGALLGISSLIFQLQETKIKTQIASLGYPSEKASLELTVGRLREKILYNTKATPSVPDFPTVQQVLSWLSSLSAPVEIVHVEYELKGAHKAGVSIEFQARGADGPLHAAAADLFVKQIQQPPSFVEPTPEVKWTSHPHGYKLSFELRKNF